MLNLQCSGDKHNGVTIAVDKYFLQQESIYSSHMKSVASGTTLRNFFGQFLWYVKPQITLDAEHNTFMALKPAKGQENLVKKIKFKKYVWNYISTHSFSQLLSSSTHISSI